MTIEKNTEVVVLGGGPGGYAAAFRAADLGKQVVLVEDRPTLGGVCLNVGCIPSKALLHVAKVIDETKHLGDWGVTFGEPKIELDKLRESVRKVVKDITGGLGQLAKRRKTLQVVQGRGTFSGTHTLDVEGAQAMRIKFDNAIIAAGSEPIPLPFLPKDPRIMDSTGALELPVTKNLLVIGGGIIGMEMATVYHALGAKITIVDLAENLIPGADTDLVKPLHQRLKNRGYEFRMEQQVTQVQATPESLQVTFKDKNGTLSDPQNFDRILVAVGRRPNGKLIGAEKAGVAVDERGFIPVNDQLKTNSPHIFAIGDIAGNPMLAHKATPQGRLAAEVIAGSVHTFAPRVIPAVAYTDPELAWIGKTETELRAQGIEYKRSVFPWSASGRARGQGRTEGLTKLLFDTKGKLIGAGISGILAGELIVPLIYAIETGCSAEDIALMVHPHPTLSETSMVAAEMYEGTATDF